MPARLARVLLALTLLAAWQAALEHPIEHASGAHEEAVVCGALDALAACASQAQPVFGELQSDYGSPSYPASAPRVAEAPPFFSQGPPVACV